MEFNDDFSNKVLGVPLSSLNVEQRMDLYGKFLEEKKTLVPPGEAKETNRILSQIVSTNEQILKNTTPTREHIVCKGSEISEKRGSRFFQCPQDDLSFVLLQIKSALHIEKPDEGILSLVVKFTQQMLDLSRLKQFKELDYVQPAVKTFLEDLKSHLTNKSDVVVEDSRSYCLKISDNVCDITINGVTDHTFKLINADVRFCVVEDKQLLQKLSPMNINQIVSQMMNELKGIEVLGFIPSIYYGILHNGTDWVFVWRVIFSGKERWYHVKCFPTFSNLTINQENCVTVAILLQYALYISDKNITDFLDPKKRVILPTTFEGSGKEESDDEDEDGGNDDDDDGDNNGDDSNENEIVGSSLVSRVKGLNISSSSIMKQTYAKRSRADKENCLPLSKANVSQQMIQKFKYF